MRLFIALHKGKWEKRIGDNAGRVEAAPEWSGLALTRTPPN